MWLASFDAESQVKACPLLYLKSAELVIPRRCLGVPLGQPLMGGQGTEENSGPIIAGIGATGDGG
jgi:hypothetical protein